MRRLILLVAVTACCATATETAGAATSAPGTVQVTVGKRVCTGAVLSPRFVLTSARCAGSAVKNLRIVPKARSTVGVKVATVLRPSGSLRRTDLALLQLTGVTSVAPVRLTPSVRKAVRNRTRGTVRGWTSARSVGRATGRVTRRRACRAGAGTLCLTANRRAIARRCGDAAGATLTVRRAGKTVLTGIGTRSRRGCARRKRLTFVDLSRRPVARFLRAALAGSGTAPVAEAPPVAPGTGAGSEDPAAATAALTPFVGSWRGDVSEDRLGETLVYPTTLTIDSGGAVGTDVGSTDYGDGTLCGGVLNYSGVLAAGTVGFTERLTVKPRNCVDGGTVALAFVSGQQQITYSWTRPGGGPETSGVLTRR